MPFFITGLPRSGTTWVSNYLTWGNMFCFHEMTLLCAGGVDKMHAQFPAWADVIGGADSSLALIQDKLIEYFPRATWVLIDRDYDDVERSVKRIINPTGLHILQIKLEELRGKVRPIVIKYEDLQERISEVASTLNPAWGHPKERHDMLVAMRIETDVEKALDTITKLPSISHIVEKVTLAPNCVEYLNLLQQMCGTDGFAFRWLRDVVNAALVWDHVKDRDALDMELFDEVMIRLITEWPINPFLQKHNASLTPVLSAAISAWKFSYGAGVGKEYAYRIYEELPAAVAFIIGGNPRVDEFMPRIRKLVREMQISDDVRDGARK